MRLLPILLMLALGAAGAQGYANLYSRNADLPVLNAVRDEASGYAEYLNGLLTFNKIGACAPGAEAFQIGATNDFERFKEAATSRGFEVKVLATFQGSDNNGDTVRPFLRLTRGEEVLYVVGYGGSKISWMKLALCKLAR